MEYKTFFGFLEDESFHTFLKNLEKFERLAKLWKEQRESKGEVFSWKEFMDMARKHNVQANTETNNEK